MNNSGFNTVLLIIVLALIVGGGIWWYTNYGTSQKADAGSTSGVQVNLGGSQQQ